MLTPLDIQNKEFRKGIRGYSEKEVDNFLDEVIADYEKIYKENIDYKEKISMLNEQLNHFNDIEETLKNTLVVAQSAAEEVRINARKKAELIIREAEENGKGLIEKARNEVLTIQKEYENLRKEISVFKTRYKTFLKSQLESIDSVERDANRK